MYVCKYGMEWYGMVWYGMAWHGMAWMYACMDVCMYVFMYVCMYVYYPVSSLHTGELIGILYISI